MNLGHLSIFHAVAQEKSVTRAARRLLVSQPAVSKQIQLLEHAVGTKLLERIPRGVRLTRAGEVLSGYARKLFAIEVEAETAMQELAGLRRGRLAIGASTTLGVYLLPEYFVKFRRQFPQIDLSLDVSNSRGVYERIADGTLDIGWTESLPVDGDFAVTRFAWDDLAAITPPDHPLARKRQVSAGEFCRAPFVTRATGSETRSFVEQVLTERGISVMPVLSLGSTEAIKRAVAAGIGVGIVSALAIEMEQKAGVLAVVRLSGKKLRRPMYRVTRRQSPVGASVSAFIEMVEKVPPLRAGPAGVRRNSARPKVR